MRLSQGPLSCLVSLLILIIAAALVLLLEENTIIKSKLKKRAFTLSMLLWLGKCMASNGRQDGRSWKLRDQIFNNKEDEEGEEDRKSSRSEWSERDLKRGFKLAKATPVM